MDTFTIFTWSLTAATIFGTLLNSRQNKYGFLVWGLCNMLWLGIDFNRGIYAQAALYVVFIGFNIYGWMQWGKRDKFVTHVVLTHDERKILRTLRRRINMQIITMVDDSCAMILSNQEMAIISNILHGR